jgi:hypothetical protein
MANKEQIVSLAEGRKKFLSAYDSLTKLQPIDVMNEKFYARPFAERLPKWRGIGTYNPDHAMFDAAKFSNVLIGMDISLLEKLSRIYNRQSALHALHNTFLHRFYEINSETTYGEVDRMVNQMRQELWGNQYLLTKEYDSVIEAIDRF